MATVNFISANKSDIINNNITSGSIYVALDTKELIVDLNDSRYTISCIIYLETDSDRLMNLAPLEDKLYIVKSTNSIWMYNSDWILLNSSDNYSITSSAYGSLTSFSDKLIIYNNPQLIDNTLFLQDLSDISNYIKIEEHIHYNGSITIYNSENDDEVLVNFPDSFDSNTESNTTRVIVLERSVVPISSTNSYAKTTYIEQYTY